MASATYRSNSSSNTTMTVDITETSKKTTSRTFTVKWTAKLGSSTSLGASHNRILYIYKSDGTLLGQSTIKNNVAWDSGKTYSGSFTFTCNVGTTNAGTLVIYIQTNSTSVTSCVWTNRDYCTNLNVPFSVSALPIKYNGQTVTALTFNGQAVTKLIFNGTTIF